jgi:hypothetical protein
MTILILADTENFLRLILKSHNSFTYDGQKRTDKEIY